MDRISIDKYIGCLLGGAIGDALGAPVEFMDIREIRSAYGEEGITDFVEFPGNVGEFTDDTQMTLFTADGLLRAAHRANLKGIGGVLNYISYQSYLRWLHTQSIDIDLKDYGPWKFDCESGWLVKQKELLHVRAPGNTCISSLSSGKACSIKAPINNSKGCGGIMRMAPVGLLFFGNPEYSFKVGCDLAAITHGHPTGYLSAGFFASVISELAAGINLMKSIDNSILILKGWNKHEETLNAVEKALDLYTRSTKVQEITPELVGTLGQGWTAEEALSISLFISLHFETDYKSGILAAVNHSGDSDSTGSITGNILGLINGQESFPEKWINNLKYSNLVKQVAEDLHTGVKGDFMYPDDEWWEKYPGY